MLEAERKSILEDLHRMVDDDVAFAEASPLPDPSLAFKGVYADEGIVERGRRGVFVGAF